MFGHHVSVEIFTLAQEKVCAKINLSKEGSWTVAAMTLNGRHTHLPCIPLKNIQFCWANEETSTVIAVAFGVAENVRLWKMHTDKNHLRSREIVMVSCVFKVKKNFDPTKDELPEPEWFLEYEDGDPIPAKVVFLQ
jgi:hypothetical protein